MDLKCTTDHFKTIMYKLPESMENLESYIKITMMLLSFKIINKCHKQTAEIVINVVLTIYDHITYDVNFELIRIYERVNTLSYSQGNGLRENLGISVCHRG